MNADIGYDIAPVHCENNLNVNFKGDMTWSFDGAKHETPNVALHNPLPPSDAVRKQKNKRISSSVMSQIKKYHPSGNLKFNI